MSNHAGLRHQHAVAALPVGTPTLRALCACDAGCRTFDLDGNGYISARELGRAMALAGLPTTGEDLMRVRCMCHACVPGG
eukprot:363807-Chlamydomonas_euryale.AAC.1